MINDSIKRQLDIQLSQKQIEEMFEDGKPHEIMFLDAIFIDGQSVHSEVHRPLVMTAVARSFEEFNQHFNVMSDALSATYRETIYEEMLATRAVARAAMIFGAEMRKRVGDSSHPTDAMEKAFSIIGYAMGVVLKDPILFEHSLSLPEPISKQFEDYLADTTLPAYDPDEEISG